MARKSPLGKIKDAALDTIKDPIGSGQKAVGQAVGQAMGTVELGKAVAGQVTGEVLNRATGLVPGRKKQGDGGTGSGAPEQSAPASPAAPAAKPAPARKATAKEHGDPVKPPVEDVATSVVKKAATRAPAAQGSVAKAGTKKASGKKALAKKTPPRKAPESPIDAAADPGDVDVTPADVAKAVAKAPAAKKTPAKKTAAKKATPSGKIPPKEQPLSAAEVAAGAGTETITPVGTRGADVATNPDTTDRDLQQVGTEPLVDPSTTKSVASEAETLGRASDPDKG